MSIVINTREREDDIFKTNVWESCFRILWMLTLFVIL